MSLTDYNQLPLPDCARSLVPDEVLRRLMETACLEDGLERGDVTTMSIIPGDRHIEARLVARQPGVIAGMALLQRAATLPPIGGSVELDSLVEDGSRISAGDSIALLRGQWREVLSRERILLNLLSRLSGVATETARYVDTARDASQDVLICDSRKTTPGLRLLEKYAVRCGGGHLHRIGLDDAVMYKDNHLASIGDGDLAAALEVAIAAARSDRPLRFVCVEVDRLEQLDVLLGMEEGLVDIVLLDNMSCAELADAVARRASSGRSIMLEASGGVTIDTLPEIARTGVDRIAVGAITHAVKWLDIGLDIPSDGDGA